MNKYMKRTMNFKKIHYAELKHARKQNIVLTVNTSPFVAP